MNLTMTWIRKRCQAGPVALPRLEVELNRQTVVPCKAEEYLYIFEQGVPNLQPAENPVPNVGRPRGAQSAFSPMTTYHSSIDINTYKQAYYTHVQMNKDSGSTTG